MKYTEEMILHSPSGYCMPFEEEENREVSMSLGYGEQKDSVTGETSFHHGVTFIAGHRPLSAVASGIVSAVGNDKRRGVYLTVRHGKYEVTYAHLSNVYVRFSQEVRAGQTVALSGNDLYMETAFDGEELNPIEFLTMLYGNIQALRQSGETDAYGQSRIDGGIRTNYDRDREEIERLMLRFLPQYMEDLFRGSYAVPEYTEQSLRNVFTVGASKDYFFETMPSMSNPLGLGRRAVPLAGKVQNLLIADFLNYLALRHDIFLSSAGGELKKNSVPKQQ